MAHHPLSISGTPITGKNQSRTSSPHALWAVFKKLKQAGEAQRDLLNKFVAERHIIPPVAENCVDSVRMSIPVPVVHRDRAHLTKLGFVLGKSLHRAKKLRDGSLADPDPGYKLRQHPFDVCRVEPWPATEEHPGKCVIEVAISRVRAPAIRRDGGGG